MTVLIYLFIFGSAGPSWVRAFLFLVASRGYSLVVVCRLLTAVVSFVAEHGL